MRNKNAKVSDPNSFVTSPGEDFRIEYTPKVMPDGKIELKESGKFSIKEFINAQRDTTDMAYILKQLTLGNVDVLDQKRGQYMDTTEMPKTYAEALQLRIDAEKGFYDLPLDVRNKFENDFNRYFATAGTKEWFEKLGVTNEKGEGEVEAPAEVKE